MDKCGRQMENRPKREHSFPGNQELGFTLVELLITIAIMAIALAIAVPNIETGRSQAFNQSREFHQALTYARAEAVNRSREVMICPSNDATVAAPVCGNDWEAGWVIFVDEDDDNVVDAAEVLRRHGELNGNVIINDVPAVATVTFDRQGFTADDSVFQFCSPAATDHGRTVVLGNSGRAIRSKVVSVCP